MDRVPVTVLTGFLGSGKTTLLNRILSENHGKRIAVIENEFGEVGVDHQLVIGAEEELFETNNGCICCTVRGDPPRRDHVGQCLVCRSCHRVVEIEDAALQRVLAERSRAAGFRVEPAPFEIKGLCNTCAEQTESRA